MTKKNNVPVILVTNDFEQFKKVAVNRKVKANKKLKESIEKYGLLPYYPIVVTPDFEVVDGQTRLATARQIMEERKAQNPDAEPIQIYYIVDNSEAIAIEDKIIIPNIARRDWSAEDWLNFYTEQKSDAYTKFKEVCDELPFSGLGNRMVIFSHGKTTSAKFKDGKLVGDAEFYKRVVSFLLETQCRLNGRTPFLQAIVTFFDTIMDKLTEEQVNSFSARLGQEVAEQVSKDAYIKRFLSLCGMNAKQRDKFLAELEK